MDSNMISDCFVGKPTSMSDRGHGRGRISISNESFVSASMNHENFGDWGSFNNGSVSFSKHDGKVSDPFSEQKEDDVDGFNIIDRKEKGAVPKLPVSRREIRKVTTNEHTQPTIIIEANQDLLLSPIPFGSPVTNSIRNFKPEPLPLAHRPEPIRSIKRSVSDATGSFSRDRSLSQRDTSFKEGDTTQPLDSNSPSTSFRSLFRAQRGGEMSLSFSQRRKPISNRALLMQIGERRKSYRNLSMDDDDDEEPPHQRTPTQRTLMMQIGEKKKSYRNLNMEDDDEPQTHRTPTHRSLLKQISERRKSYRNLMMEEEDYEPRPLPPLTPLPQPFNSDDDEPFEGTLPLKAEPESIAVKKRSSSRDRLNKMRSEDSDSDHYNNPRPSRKSSLTSRSSANGNRRLGSRKMSLTDSHRSNGSKGSKGSNKRTPRPKRDEIPQHDEIEFYVEPSSQAKSPFSSDPERTSMLAEVKRQRDERQSEKEVRRSNSWKKSSKKKSQGTTDEIKKHTNRCKNRRNAGRRASMTGNIVDMDDDSPREKRRSSMDHFKPSTAPSQPKERTRRRATMDHYRPSPTKSISPVEDRKKSRSKSDIKALSDRDMPLSSAIFSTRVPFGEEGTETTKGTEDSQDIDRGRPLSRKASIEKVKSIDRRSNSAKRKVGRSRSGLKGQRQRSNSRNRQSEAVDKTVTVAEILACVSNAHKPRQRRPRSNTNDSFDISNRSGGQLDVSSRSGNIDISNRSGSIDISSRSGSGNFAQSSHSDLSRGRNSNSCSPKATNRKTRSRSRQKGSQSSFNRIRKGKRVEHHPEEPPAENKEQPVVVGKESRNRWGGRRGSAR